MLEAKSPSLKKHVRKSPAGEATIDFADPEAVKALNRALLRHYYDLEYWDIPEGYLCPPIPGRADYIHALADLLGPAKAPRRILDVGVGANCIYPILGHLEYGWKFVGTDIDRQALKSAQEIVRKNEKLRDAIELRAQTNPERIFEGVVAVGESFDATLCNPPFHSSLAEARSGTDRKWKGLGKSPTRRLNFGGQGAELWVKGGELGFITRMIQESVDYAAQIGWFSTLVSKSENLKRIEGELRKLRAREVRRIEMAQGQKKSRVVAWRF